MIRPLIWLTEAEVVSLVTLDDAIDAVEHGLRALGQGKAFNIAKALGGWGDGSSMHSLGSALPEGGYAGYKNWVHTKRGATAVFCLFDANDGSLLAVMEAAALGQLRTAAMTGVGTKWLAPGGANELALLGTGAQSITQVAAINAVRPLDRVRVWSPTVDKRRAFVEKLRQSFDFELIDSPSAESAVEGAPLVTLVTRAKEPFVTAKMLARGAHLNAVGAILPQNAEFAQDVFGRAGIVAVDDLANVQKASREFIEYYEKGGRGWKGVRLISDIIAKGEARPTGCDLSLFKAMGMGLSDLSVAVMALERARAQAVGRTIAQPVRVVPRWNVAAKA
jgi:ornithine cyclodeaminase